MLRVDERTAQGAAHASTVSGEDGILGKYKTAEVEVGVLRNVSQKISTDLRESYGRDTRPTLLGSMLSLLGGR